MYTFEDLQHIVNEALTQEQFVKEPSGLYEPIQYALDSGGKRLRPVLALMAYNLFEDDIHSKIKSLLGLEIFHNFTLIHDDIMDGANIRRNRPTIHNKWNNNVAILSGDAMFIKAYDYFFQYKGNNFTHILTTFNQTALMVCEGQQYDMNFEEQDSVLEQDYLRMIELKTAVLLASSLKIGALMADASNDDVGFLRQFGLFMGMAFQLQDDYLDAFGDAKVFGKKIGGDIAANKKTYLFIKTLEMARDHDKEFLLNLFDPEYSGNSEDKIQKVISVYKKYDVHNLTQEKIEEYFKKANEALAKINVNSDNKKHLFGLADKLVKRKM